MRAAGGIPHPVEDFLFTYYSLRPGQLRRWYPGVHIALADAQERAGWPFHRVLPGAPSRVAVTLKQDPSSADVSNPEPSSGGDPNSGDPAADDPPAGAVAVDVPAFLRARGVQVAFTRRLLTATSSAPGQFGCFGLHEWAMVFEQDEADRRHAGRPLRLGQAGTDEVVRDHQIRCTHYDAFRFFTPRARPLNFLQPDLGTRVQLEQPGCLHASMDLYKWAYKLIPIVPSDLLLDAFSLAKRIRELDMRASPYDLSDLGYPPVRIETAAGKAEYVAAQREFAADAQVLRGRLLDVLTELDGQDGRADPQLGPAQRPGPRLGVRADAGSRSGRHQRRIEPAQRLISGARQQNSRNNAPPIMITAPTSPMIPVTLSDRAATSTDQDGSTYASRPSQSPATAAPASEVALAVITARAAVSGGTGLRVEPALLVLSRGRIRLRSPRPAIASPMPTRAAASPANRGSGGIRW